MIRQKMDLAKLINSLNELEKLKLLLFDEDQYYLFEHIPKPYLVDTTVAMGKKNLIGNYKVFLTGNKFWHKSNYTTEDSLNHFCKALYNIKQKEKQGELNVIDKRLLEILKLYKD